MKRRSVRLAGGALLFFCVAAGGEARSQPNPILLVTQVPIPSDFETPHSTFANHLADTSRAPRGGDLWIRYTDGSLRNLTLAAGYGVSCAPGTVCFQGASSISVREPSMYWDGTKAIFSMVVGAPTTLHVPVPSVWQLYEISGLQANQQPVITRIPNQPPNYNNVAPFYGTDDRILFTSDRPRSGEPHLYPQLDEYKLQRTVTALYSLDPVTGDLTLKNHVPSGLFSPSIDSFGRIIMTRWDHLQRDAFADDDTLAAQQSQPTVHGTFDAADESPSAPLTATTVESFPEPQAKRTDLLAAPPYNHTVGMEFNQFFPWTLNEDGTGEEIVNHAGRHDFRFAVGPAFDTTFGPDLKGFLMFGAPYPPPLPRTNQNFISNALQIKESPVTPGHYFAVDAPESGTHAGGQVIEFDAPPTTRPDQIPLTWWSDPSGAAFFQGAGPDPNVNHTGHYRNPLPLSDGTLIVSHSAEMRADANQGTAANPVSRYAYRLKTFGTAPLPAPAAPPAAAPAPPFHATTTGGVPFAKALATMTTGIVKSVSWYDPDVLVTYSNVTMWELDAVEVRARTRPAVTVPGLAAPEQTQFNAALVDATAFKRWMAANDLALIVSRNVTTRDVADTQQPFNLQVKLHNGTLGATTTGAPNTKLDFITHLQLFQADLLRGLGGAATPQPGRRPIARPMHDAAGLNLPNPTPGAPAGTIVLGADGSMAAFVPSHRALSWQLTDDAFTPIVHERYWLTFQPGEVRVCASCHGLNNVDQANGPVPTNPPAALLSLLQQWKQQQGTPPATPWPPVINPGFYTLPPCRVFDTRLPDGAGGGPQLVASGTRRFSLANRCGIPPTAVAVSINVTAVAAGASGALQIFPGNGAVPNTSSLSFNTGVTRANNVVMGLSTDGVGTLKFTNGSGGGTHVIADVNGYFR